MPALLIERRTQRNGVFPMGWKRQLLTGANVIANRAGLRVLSHGEYDYVMRMFITRDGESPPPPKEALGYLRLDHPRLEDLRSRYQNHPAAEHSHWRER